MSAVWRLHYKQTVGINNQAVYFQHRFAKNSRCCVRLNWRQLQNLNDCTKYVLKRLSFSNFLSFKNVFTLNRQENEVMISRFYNSLK